MHMYMYVLHFVYVRLRLIYNNERNPKQILPRVPRQMRNDF